MTGRPFEPTIHTDLEPDKDYAGYLRLDLVLNAQEMRSQPAYHDEMLFIIQHQTSELWMKLVIHELGKAMESIRADALPPCFKVLARVKQIQRMLFEQWAVLETLTPTEFGVFRSALGRASGLQSFQNRMIEFLLGNKDAKSIEVFRHKPEVYGELQRILSAPSLYDEFLRYLRRNGHPIPAEVAERDWSQPYVESEAVISVFKAIYESPENHWEAYEMAEKLIDVEEQYALWRFRHIKTVERIIGFKRGTGGSSGAGFLRQGLEIRLFPELWDVRTLIGT
jgi:tryptophan 2,3-dioxygenase